MLALAVGVLAGWIGYRNEVAAVTAAGKPPLTFRSAARHLLTPKAERDAVKQLEAMRQRGGRGGLTPAETAACWRIIRGFSEEQVKNYLADLPRGDMGANPVLTAMLFQRWAQLAPETAAREAMTDRYKDDHIIPRYVLCAWFEKDRDGAARWVEANGSDPFKNISGFFIGRMLVREDPLTALVRAEKEYPAAVGTVLRTMAGDMGATAESRKAFIALHAKYGGTRDWDRAIYALGSVAAEKDPENLLATVKGTGMPPGKSLQYRNQAIDSLMRQNPEKVMAWMLDPASGVSAEKLRSVYGDWATQHSKEATDWAVKNGKPELIAEGVKSYATSKLRHGSLFGTDDWWSRDLPERFGAWKSVEPAAAETWLHTMPSDIRKFLITERSTDATK